MAEKEYFENLDKLIAFNRQSLPFIKEHPEYLEMQSAEVLRFN